MSGENKANIERIYSFLQAFQPDRVINTRNGARHPRFGRFFITDHLNAESLLRGVGQQEIFRESAGENNGGIRGHIIQRTLHFRGRRFRIEVTCSRAYFLNKIKGFFPVLLGDFLAEHRAQAPHNRTQRGVKIFGGAGRGAVNGVVELNILVVAH